MSKALSQRSHKRSAFRPANRPFHATGRADWEKHPLWLWNTMFIAVSSTILSIVAGVVAAYAIVIRPF